MMYCTMHENTFQHDEISALLGVFLYSIWLSKEVNFGFLLVSHNHQKYIKSITLCVKYQRVSLFEQYYWFILDELIYKDS